MPDDGLQDERSIIPWDDEPRPTGQICYEAWAGTLGWRFRGARLPSWKSLEPYEREAFTEGAHTVIQKGWAEAQPSSTAKRRRH
jgi:hypothetical protein